MSDCESEIIEMLARTDKPEEVGEGGYAW